MTRDQQVTLSDIRGKERSVFEHQNATVNSSSGSSSSKTMHSVRVQQTYWLDERSELRLQQLGAVLTDEVVVKDDYYDNDTFDLATNQIWLSQRDSQWQLIVARPTSNANGGDGRRGERSSLVSKPEARRKGRSENTGGATSGESYERKHGSTPKNSTKEGQRKQVKGPGERNSTEEDQAATEPRLRGRTSSDEADAVTKEEPRYTHEELRAHQEIMEYIAQFLQISLVKAKEQEEGDANFNQFLQLAKIHHYASCHSAKRRTYALDDTYRVVIEKDELAPRCVARMEVDADVSNIIRELDKMDEIAVLLRMEPCQTEQILA
ncbi:uncharacterized protein si:dkey-191c17.2 [Leucoraja erinacea]|uniref:uncharacterized protein si:dkey-191c17.2 n=1 Tax=Leucoraja erinaceus TaxID=7782 RepID=UPI0024583948|nr:uncharacterized protein si:dkey-191c17.2 [Leucoraja erinacea]